MSIRATPVAPCLAARLLEEVGQAGDGRAVVEQAGQRVAPAGLEQGLGLAGQAPLGGLEDAVEEQAAG